MADDGFDLIVVGGGPGGYVAAIRAAQLGLNTAVVERDKVGGRCLNYACIPAKTMLHTAEVLDEAKNGAHLGVKTEGVELDWEALSKRRAEVSAGLESGIGMLFKKNGITVIEGEASLTPEGDVEVDGKTYAAGKVILATGSVAMPIPGTEFSDRVVDTWGGWSLPEQPAKIAVAGAGASGAEIASAYIRYGTDVILVEMLDQVLPTDDPDVARVVERTFKKQGVEISTGTPVEDVKPGEESVSLKYGDATAEVDYLIIAGGRRPDIDPLGLEAAGVELDEAGKVKVGPDQLTSNQKVYAVGDLTPGPALAHKAMEEGIVAAESAAGQPVHPVDMDLIPSGTFCHPQVASVGLTEAEAKEQGIEPKVAKFKLGGVGAGSVYEDRDGVVKLVVDPAYGEIVGAHVVGNRACDMIPELVAVMALEGGYQELARMTHPHPTISEAVLDAARAVDGWATHA
ncbi:MAG: dihydrolipoyl dehydrogenase [Solirubrobacterales bacterium]